MISNNPIRSFLFLFKSGLVAQIFLLASIPVILNKYNPSSFGAFTLIISISTVIGVVSSLKLERALVVEEKVFLPSIVKLCIVLAVSLSFLCYVILDGLLALELIEIDSTRIPFLASAYCFFFGASQLLAHMAMREEKTGLIGRSDILFGSAVFILILLLPTGNSGSRTLLNIYLIARVVSLLPFIGLEKDRWCGYTVSRLPAKEDLLDYVKPVVTTLLSNMQFRGLYFLSGIQFGVAATGHLSLAHRVTYAPINLIGTALRRAYFLKFSEVAEESKEINRHVSIVLIYGTLALCFLAPLLVVTLNRVSSWLSPEWSAVGSYLLLLYPAASVLITLSWLDRVYDARKKQGLALKYEMAYTIVLYTVLLFVSARVTMHAFIGTYTLITVIYNIYWAEMTRRVLGLPIKTSLVLALGNVILVSFCFFMVFLIGIS